MVDTSKTIPPINRNYNQSGIYSARQMNEIGRELGRLSSSIDLTKTPTGYKYSATGGDAGNWTLQCNKTGNDAVTVTAGTISFGGTDMVVAETDITLTGETEFVYVKVARASNTATVEHAAVRPSSGSTNWYLILTSYTATAGTYGTATVHHRGDYNGTLPLIS